MTESYIQKIKYYREKSQKYMMGGLLVTILGALSNLIYQTVPSIAEAIFINPWHFHYLSDMTMLLGCIISVVLLPIWIVVDSLHTKVDYFIHERNYARRWEQSLRDVDRMVEARRERTERFHEQQEQIRKDELLKQIKEAEYLPDDLFRM